MSTKVCTDCGEDLSLENFYNDKRRKDGKYSNCKKCHYANGRKSYIPRTRKPTQTPAEKRKKARNYHTKRRIGAIGLLAVYHGQSKPQCVRCGYRDI